jgi:quaternary ammonium compound-resistance protein SugE
MLRKFNKVNFTSRIDQENPPGFSCGRNAPYLSGTGKTFL